MNSSHPQQNAAAEAGTAEFPVLRQALYHRDILPILCLTKFYKLCEVLYVCIQTIDLPRHRWCQREEAALSVFVLNYRNLFLQNKVKYLNFTVLAGCFEWEIRKWGFQAYMKKVAARSAV